MKNFVLASKSIDRKELFKRLKIAFEILITEINENKYKKKQKNPIELVKDLAKAKVLKAKEILTAQNRKAVIIAADTVAEFEGNITILA